METTENPRIVNVYFEMEGYELSAFIKALEALQYLGKWSATAAAIDIYRDSTLGKYGMIAHYRNKDDKPFYTIGALWNDDTQKFSFHS